MYEPIIGLEIHARIRTATKLFCSCANDPLPEYANKNTCPICMGFPGMLPVPNKEALRLAIKASLALGCSITSPTKFDRKNYFYPDLPMGYQISQYDQPLGQHGSLIMELSDGTKKSVYIERLHVENDAGKLTHGSLGSYVDYNRSGAPLMEVVSGPELYSVEEASAYARAMQQIMRAVEASDCDMEKGQMRFDANISLRPVGETRFGTKVEIKNLNSFRSLEKALRFEIERQTILLNQGEAIIQETRGWDDDREVTLSQRTKEGAADYRYFPEPDIPPLTFSNEYIESIRQELPELPLAQKERYQTIYGLDRDLARILVEDDDLDTYFQAVLSSAPTLPPKLVATWITSTLLNVLSTEHKHTEELPFTQEAFAALLTMLAEDKISSISAKEVFEELCARGGDPLQIATNRGLLQVSDTSALLGFVEEVLSTSPQQVADYKAGKVQLLGYFVGQVMKKSGGSAHPKIVGELVQQKLAE